MKKLMLNILDILGVMVFVLLLILLSPFIVGIMLYQIKDGEWENIENYEIMQFTGLYDKNGREIYEGDIIRCYGGAYWNGIYEYNYVIEVRDIRDLNEIVHSENVEILGNKYENPELLEESE